MPFPFFITAMLVYVVLYALIPPIIFWVQWKKIRAMPTRNIEEYELQDARRHKLHKMAMISRIINTINCIAGIVILVLYA